MSTILILIVLWFTCSTRLVANAEAIHLPLSRRSGRFVLHEVANITRYRSLLRATEDRYCRTNRNLQGNRLVRKWLSEYDDHAMLDEAGLSGRWYATVSIGKPAQVLELDLDFLNPNFYTVLTTSNGGSKFNTFASESHSPSDTYIHPLCRLAADNLQIAHQQNPVSLEWPICNPSKSSRHTLAKSGNILGLAPNPRSYQSSLSRFTASGLIQTLHQQALIPSSLWSITVIDSTSGILSLGGTLATEIEEAKQRTEAELKYLAQEDALSKVKDEVRAKMSFAIPLGSGVDDHFKWIDVSGAGGWWTGLMSGIFINGIKIMKNQPFIIDLSCPFIIAPPTAFDHFYHSIIGTKSLHQFLPPNLTSENMQGSKEDQFRLFPCLNPPSVAIELAGWPFPLASSTHTTNEDALNGPAGGPFSLGKVEEDLNTNVNSSSEANAQKSVNSGYCVGVVVQSDMGERDEERWRDSGMRDTWVLGEPFFRGMGVVFDDGEERDGKSRMGFRIY